MVYLLLYAQESFLVDQTLVFCVSHKQLTRYPIAPIPTAVIFKIYN